MSKRTELADALVALLNGEGTTFSMQFEAKRRVMPYVNRAEVKTVQVSVFTGLKSSDRRTRTEFSHTYKPFIAVQKEIAGSGEAARTAASDEVQEVVEEIEGFFEALDEPVAELAFIGFDEADAERESYDPEFMRDGVFSSTITLEFQD